MKLVRDRVPELIVRNGDQCTVMQITKQDALYVQLLKQKLLEEVIEFQREGDIEELADVLEVVYAFMRMPEYANLRAFCEMKRNADGQFEKGFVLLSTTNQSK